MLFYDKLDELSNITAKLRSENIIELLKIDSKASMDEFLEGLTSYEKIHHVKMIQINKSGYNLLRLQKMIPK